MAKYSKTISILAAVLMAILTSIATASVHIQTPHYIISGESETLIKKRAAHLEWSAYLFEDLFAVAPPTGNVTLSDNPVHTGTIESKYGVGGAVVQATVGNLKENWSLQWFIKPPGKNRRGTPPHDALTHEAAHLQLIYLVNAHATDEMKAQYNGYGAYLPDWIDEAVAVYHEPQATKAHRRKQVQTKLLPLSELFNMSHPMFAASKTSASVHSGSGVKTDRHHNHENLEELIKDGKVNAADLIKDGDRLETLKRVNQFYVQSLAVLEYMIDQGGKPFVRYMIDQQARGQSMENVLRNWSKKQRELVTLQRNMQRIVSGSGASDSKSSKRKNALPPAKRLAGVWVRPNEKIGRMPGSIKSLEKDFDKWVRRHYPRHQPKQPVYPK